MSDPYNGDAPHDMEQDEALASVEPVHEAPSEEEFAEAAEHTEEHLEDHAHSDTVVRKRSPLLPIAAAAGGILLLGAAAWWQFSGSDTPNGDVPMVVAAPAAVPAPVAPALAPVAPATPTVAAEVVAPAPVVPAQPVTPAETAALPAAHEIAPEPVAPVAVTAPQAAAVAAKPTVAAVEAADDQRIQDLTARIDTLQKSLDAANTQISQMTNIAAANARPITADSEGVIVAAPAKALAPSPTHHHIARKPAHKPVTGTHEKPVAASGHWVLRAAMPGQAWVSPSATSRELKQLHLGDTLPGIGRVTGIIRQGDDWVVVGTKGSLK